MIAGGDVVGRSSVALCDRAERSDSAALDISGAIGGTTRQVAVVSFAPDFDKAFHSTPLHTLSSLIVPSRYNAIESVLTWLLSTAPRNADNMPLLKSIDARNRSVLCSLFGQRLRTRSTVSSHTDVCYLLAPGLTVSVYEMCSAPE